MNVFVIGVAALIAGVILAAGGHSCGGPCGYKHVVKHGHVIAVKCHA